MLRWRFGRNKDDGDVVPHRGSEDAQDVVMKGAIKGNAQDVSGPTLFYNFADRRMGQVTPFTSSQ